MYISVSFRRKNITRAPETRRDNRNLRKKQKKIAKNLVYYNNSSAGGGVYFFFFYRRAPRKLNNGMDDGEEGGREGAVLRGRRHRTKHYRDARAGHQTVNIITKP